MLGPKRSKHPHSAALKQRRRRRLRKNLPKKRHVHVKPHHKTSRPRRNLIPPGTP